MRKIVAQCATGLTLAAGLLAGCDRASPPRTEHASDGATVGQKIDNAIDRTERGLAQAGARTRAGLERAGEKAHELVASTGECAKGDGAADAGAAGHAKTDTAVGTGARTSVQADGTGKASAGLGDAVITASIKADILKDPDLSVLKIDVDTHDGVVTLNGLAENEDARKRAERIASSIKGVREVRNYLTVKRL